MAKVKMLIITNAGVDTELDPSYIAGRNVRWQSHWKIVRQLLIQVKHTLTT